MAHITLEFVNMSTFAQATFQLPSSLRLYGDAFAMRSPHHVRGGDDAQIATAKIGTAMQPQKYTIFAS